MLGWAFQLKERDFTFVSSFLIKSFSTFSDPLVTNYAKFLKEGIAKAEMAGH